MQESIQYKIFKVFNVFILLVIVFCTLYPFLNVVAQSFSSEAYISAGEVNLIPKGFNMETYKTVIEDRMFWINYKNTVVYTVVGTAISMFFTTIFAYALSKRRLVGRRFLTLFAVFTMFFNGGLIPNYLLINNLGFHNTIWAIVIPGAISIYNMLIMKSFFENMPDELEEAAAMDGMNTYGILLKIVLPLSKAVMATMVLFYAVGHWNSWFPAFLYLDQKDLFPVTIYLRNMIAGATGGAAAGATSADNLIQISANIKSVTMVLTILPILTVYPFVQKYFVSGVMLGSVK
ncbi:carbohydrate ABC transporter permease [Shouchella clausii]|jgi:putative aldouronate transport system permease protein|uniref:Carbohydrate ABC transporter permease n=2 Tax=Shouchella TaxID=2893057 RepID=A0A268NY94_SHOCL|nr:MULTISPECIES: carbohydrate ABC transporter permease [Shouchella]MCM3314498.1 carbohydrate ABC transporter permease [Psychrobacillus sp. MER TA 17]ALA52300.1 Xylose ABC transporter, permease component [Shouchella clausii]KKI88380.1 sugar ABC transporter permease [Shouchella clausii]MBU3230265.1 carbohydrate ABC transporter permease [Shouchella clausii]MBU3262536.1 carbohydrate ABC transporter permease [Shouchella clausii]